MATQEPQTQYIHARCPECGGQLVYAQAGPVRQLKCTVCAYARGMGTGSDQVQGRALGTGVKLDHLRRGMQTTAVSLSCQACKSVLIVSATLTLSRCPFCEGEAWTPGSQHEKVIEPFSLIPFSISQRSARSQLRRHLGRLWLLPPEVQAVLQDERLHAVYVPVFLFDVLNRSTWRAMVGFSMVEDTKAGKQDRKVWEPSTGYYEHFFENVDIPTTSGLNTDQLKAIIPYDWSKLVPYDPRYLRDTPVEAYQENEIGTFRLADQVLDLDIQEAVIGRLPGHEVNKLVITSEKLSIAFRHVLVPVWVASCTYRGKRYTYLINGQTGKLNGKRPISNRRLFILMASIFLLCVLLVLLFS